MLTDEEFLYYKEELNSLEYIPSGWSNKKQNDLFDNKINIFDIYSYNDLIN